MTCLEYAFQLYVVFMNVHEQLYSGITYFGCLIDFLTFIFSLALAAPKSDSFQFERVF